MQETAAWQATNTTTADTENHKQSPEDLQFSLERPASRRLKKAPIILLMVAVGILLVGTLYVALNRHSPTEEAEKHALIDLEAIKRAMPDALKLTNRDFATAVEEAAPAVPTLGPPLKGDLGGLQLKPSVIPATLPVQQALPKPAPVVAYQPTPPPKQPTPEELAQLRREELARQMAEKALTAGLFFDVPTQPQSVRNVSGVAGQGNNVNALPSPVGLAPRAFQANQPQLQNTLYPNSAALQQSQYQQLIAASRLGQGGLGYQQANTPAARLQPPGSTYQVKAGTLIPAVLLTGINADLPGQIIAQVREQVFDTVTGQYLLIPQGTRVLGQYDNNVGYGQERAGVVWNRLILPDGSSINLGDMPGVDGMGQSGYQDQVDHHWGRLATGVILSSLLAGTAGYQSDHDGFAGRFYNNVGTEINRTGRQLTRSNLNIQPTIQIRPGFSINILVNRDLTLKPIAPNQSNAWEAGLFPTHYQ